MKQIIIKILTVILIIIMITALVLLASGTLDQLYFWIILAICAIISFWGIPKLRKR